MTAGERICPGIHDVDGIFGVNLVAGNIPEERLRVGGRSVALFILAAMIRVGVRTAFARLPGMGNVSHGTHRTGLGRFEGGFPRLNTCRYFALDEIQLDRKSTR